MDKTEIDKLRKALSEEREKRVIAESKLEASERAFFNAIDQLRAEKRDVESEFEAKSVELEEFARFSNQSPYATMRISADGKLLYSNKKAREIVRGLPKEAQDSMQAAFFHKVSDALNSLAPVTGEFMIAKTTYHVTFASVQNLGYVNVFAVDISEQEKLRKYFDVLSSFSAHLIETQTEEDVAWTIAQQAISKLGYSDCVVYLKDPITGEFVQKSAYGSKNPRDLELANPIRIQPGKGIVGHVAAMQAGEYVDDVRKDERYIPDHMESISEICVPIVVNGETVAVIDSENSEYAFYGEEDLSILTAIASVASSRLQRIKAIQDVRQEKERFRSFVENAFGGIYIIRQNKFEYANAPFFEIIGYTEEEAFEDSFNFFEIITVTDAEAIKAIEERKSGDRSPKSYKLELDTKAGEKKHLAVNTTILEDDKGPYTLGICLDITFIEESRTQLTNLNLELEKRNEELRQFAHLASHNLRAPVTNLMGLLEHFDRTQPGCDTNEFIIQEFEKSVNSLSLTLEEMHQVLKMRAEKNVELNTIKLSDSFNQVTELIKEQIASADAIIFTDFDVDEIRYVKGHIDNIMLNMITNAIKYAKPQNKPEIRVSSALSGSDVIISFKDNGLGINMEKYGDQIFGMYKRFHSHPDSRGLGLYLVKTQVEQLGGSIEVESSPGMGSEFKITLRAN